MGYMFGASVGAFLLSKEIWIVEHGFIEFVGFWLAMTYMVKKAGPGMAKCLDAIEANYRQKHWEEPIEERKASGRRLARSICTRLSVRTLTFSWRAHTDNA